MSSIFFVFVVAVLPIFVHFWSRLLHEVHASMNPVVIRRSQELIGETSEALVVYLYLVEVACEPFPVVFAVEKVLILFSVNELGIMGKTTIRKQLINT